MPVPLIPQNLLAEYFRLAQQEKQCKAQRLKLREQILQLQQHKARVERGPYRLQLKEYSVQPLTRTSLTDVLGHHQFEVLLDQLPSSLRVRVQVSASGREIGTTTPRS